MSSRRRRSRRRKKKRKNECEDDDGRRIRSRRGGVGVRGDDRGQYDNICDEANDPYILRRL